MEQLHIYEDIAKRTGGSVFIGVVGPVRTGKSTFIKRFMETLVFPHMENQYLKERTVDELPQSAAGRTIMTTEPKFIPEEAVGITLEDNVSLKVRLIDCVGYIVPSSLGYFENNQPRMVITPWFEEEVPFNMAAEIGTEKVINDHSTIGLVITTDGSFTDIPRDEYEEAEERILLELSATKKPTIVLLNSAFPNSEETRKLAEELEEKYQRRVIPVSCADLGESEIKEILKEVLYEFPLKEMEIALPKWVISLPKEHPVKREIFDSMKSAADQTVKIGEVRNIGSFLSDCPSILKTSVDEIDLGRGLAKLSLTLDPTLFYRILEEATGLTIENEAALLPCMIELSDIKRRYDKLKGALDEVNATGYGIVMPSMDELTLDEPEIVKQGGKYGIKLKASAPSIHMMRADIETEVSPIVGSEKQSEELILYLLKEFEENPKKIWESNIFGKSLHELVNEGLHNKLYRMPSDARMKLKETVERIINEGCNGLVCLIL